MLEAGVLEDTVVTIRALWDVYGDLVATAVECLSRPGTVIDVPIDELYSIDSQRYTTHHRRNSGPSY